MAGTTPAHELEEAVRGLAAASHALAGPDVRVRTLNAIAESLAASRTQIIRVASDETALTQEELEPEFDRMTGTLRMFAALVREGSWVRAAIDLPMPAGGAPIGPNHDIRKMLIPFGPVAVFGASNFPLAYGVCGGDTASALAAGCPVIVKEHPAHPKTGRLVHRLASKAAAGSGSPAALGYVANKDHSDLRPAEHLVRDPAIRAVGFTGSLRGGLAIHNLATTRSHGGGFLDPIPVFAEMGSCNVIVVLRHAFDRNCEQIADAVATSLLMRVGQQCTAPSVLLVAGYERADWIYAALEERIARAPLRRMLSPAVAANYYRRLDHILSDSAIEAHTPPPNPDQRMQSLGVPTLFKSQAVKMEDSPSLWEETFGPGLIVTGCGSMAHGYFFTPAALAVSLFAEPEDLVDDDSCLFDEAFIGSAAGIAAEVRQRAGRLTFNSVPTGVRVCNSMVHGGPFPATNRPDTTAVGPLAIERWCRPVCFQNCPDVLLPPELQDANPRGIWRTVNGESSREPVRRPNV